MSRDSNHTSILGSLYLIILNFTLPHNFKLLEGNLSFTPRYSNFPFTSIVRSKRFAYTGYERKESRNNVDITVTILS